MPPCDFTCWPKDAFFTTHDRLDIWKVTPRFLLSFLDQVEDLYSSIQHGTQALQHSGPYPANISNLSIFFLKDGSQSETGIFRVHDLTGAGDGGTLSFWSSPLASEHRGCTSYLRSSITTMLNMELTVN